MPKITKLCLHLLKLFRKNSGLFFSGHGVEFHCPWKTGPQKLAFTQSVDGTGTARLDALGSHQMVCFDRYSLIFLDRELIPHRYSFAVVRLVRVQATSGRRRECAARVTTLFKEQRTVTLRVVSGIKFVRKCSSSK